jgi:ABC-type amino acid transport substrate-binding protein
MREKRHMFRVLALVIVAMFPVTTLATTIHYVPAEKGGDERLDYMFELIKLALAKSAPTEKIDFQATPSAVSFARAIHDLKRDIYPNLFMNGGPNIESLGDENLQAVDFPIDHGLLSYRICFVSPNAEKGVASAQTIDDLRKFTVAQGSNWSDVRILRDNGFRVIEVPLYASLFKMVVVNRVDLVCRGISELRKELVQFQHYGNLIYDKKVLLIYTMPYKMYFNKSSAPLIAKIESGIAIAHRDGSLDQLFNKFFSADITFAKISKRKRFMLSSGYEHSLSETYQQYLYNPFATKNESKKNTSSKPNR